jgi:hypothetical protein
MVLLGVNDAENYHPVPDDLIKQFVRKATDDDTPEVKVVEPGQLRIVPQIMQGGSDLIDPFLAQTDTSPRIPVPRHHEIPFGFRTDEYQPFHDRLRKRASTSDQVEPASGLAS